MRAGARGWRLMVLCGRSFSAESTVAIWLRDGFGGYIVSFDAINEARGLHGGQGIALEEWIRTSEVATRQARRRLPDGDTVIVDESSSPRILRDGWRALAAELDIAMVLVFIDTAVSTTRQRQIANRRSRIRPDVTDAVMDGHLAGSAPPEPDERAIAVFETSTPEQVLAGVAAELGGVS